MPLHRGRQRPLEWPPQWRRSPGSPGCAAAVGREITILDAVLVAHRRRGLAFVRDRPKQEALGLLAVGTQGRRSPAGLGIKRIELANPRLGSGVRGQGGLVHGVLNVMWGCSSATGAAQEGQGPARTRVPCTPCARCYERFEATLRSVRNKCVDGEHHGREDCGRDSGRGSHHAFGVARMLSWRLSRSDARGAVRCEGCARRDRPAGWARCFPWPGSR